MFCAFWALDMAPTLDVLVLLVTDQQDIFCLNFQKRQFRGSRVANALSKRIKVWKNFNTFWLSHFNSKWIIGTILDFNI